jgi:hypothetical protein
MENEGNMSTDSNAHYEWKTMCGKRAFVTKYFELLSAEYVFPLFPVIPE